MVSRKREWDSVFGRQLEWNPEKFGFRQKRQVSRRRLSAVSRLVEERTRTFGGYRIALAHESKDALEFAVEVDLARTRA